MDKTSVRVGLIADQQQFVPTVADWWWHEWGDSYVVLLTPPPQSQYKSIYFIILKPTKINMISY
jgi:hypothetical protein